MIIAAVKLSDIELDVDAETGETKRKRSWAGGFLRDIYITAMLLAPRFITENNFEREFPRDEESKNREIE